VSYPYSAYAVDLKKVVAAAGSKDKKLESALKKKFADEYEENAEWFEDALKKGAPRLETAIAEIIAGTVPKKSKHGFQYGYAVEKLVMHFGKRIDEDELGLGSEDAIDPFLKKAKQPSFAKLTKTGASPIPIPIPDDFPVISTMTPKDVAALQKSLAAIAAPIKKEDDDDAQEVADALKSWCKKAAAKKQGLVFFVY
jgi:hypothetical protein